jgi:importin subunit beta-1
MCYSFDSDPNAEAKLQEAVKSNYPETAKALVAELANDSKPLQARHLASIFFKNTLNAKSQGLQHEAHDRWKHLEPATRQLIKDTLMAAMRGPDTSASKFAAIAASEIACVELPYEEWGEFVQGMQMILQDPAIPDQNKQSALECIGFTCERIDEVQQLLPDVPDLSDATLNALLTAIVQEVQSDRSDARRFAALQALSKSLNFVHKNMDVKEERDFIVQNALCGAAQSQNGSMRQLAFRSLDIVAELYYDKIQDYMARIFELTSGAIKSDTNDEVKQSAIEFWCTVAETEESMLSYEEDLRQEGRTLDRPACKKYTESAMPLLVPLLLETLSKQHDDLDEDSTTLSDSGAICLESMSITVKDAIGPHVIPFVQQHISSPDWRLRDAAIIAFTGILDGPSTALMGPYVSGIIPSLMAALNDSNEIVRDSATNCIGIIGRLHIHALKPEEVVGVLVGLAAKLQENPRIAGRASSGIFNIASNFKTTDDVPETNILSQPMLPLLQALLAATDRPDSSEGNVRISAMSAASELVAASARDSLPILQELLPLVVGRIQQTLNMDNLGHESRDNKDVTLGLLAGLITVLFQRLGKEGVAGAVDSVMTCILQILQVPNANCHEEAFMAIGAIATLLEGDFQKYLQPLMPYIGNALNNHQSHQLYIVAVGVIVDICSAVGSSIQPYCDAIMTALTGCLKDGSAHRETKPVVLACIGDIAMAIGAAFEPYFQVSTLLLMQAAGAQMQHNDDDSVDFINRLRHAVLEAYVGIIMGLADGNMLNLFVANVSTVMQFLQYLSTPESYKDDLCLQKAVALIGDIAQQMGQNPLITQQLRLPFVATLVEEAIHSNDPSTQEIADWTKSAVTEVLCAQP